MQIQCQCGGLKGELKGLTSARRIICYCKDCQEYAKRLGKKKILDANGGTEIIGTQARHLSFTEGTEHLACGSLTEDGLLRWYASCCKTPIANTPRDWRFSYVGLVHTALAKPLEASFPRVDMHMNNQSAIGTPPKPRRGQFFTLLGFMMKLMPVKWLGGYKRTPFFGSEGMPVVEVRVLSDGDKVASRPTQKEKL